jgi:hypothetical protein
MIENPDVIPIAVVTAVIIFMAKEVIEAFRRWKLNVRKLDAIRRFVALECERNEFALNTLMWQMVEVDDALSGIGKLTIEKRQSGRHRLVMTRDKDSVGSAPIPTVHTDTIRKYLFEAASLDAGLFHNLENTLEALIDAEHVSHSLVEYVSEDPNHLSGFTQFARPRLTHALESNRELYFKCTCEPLVQGRVR